MSEARLPMHWVKLLLCGALVIPSACAESAPMTDSIPWNGTGDGDGDGDGGDGDGDISGDGDTGDGDGDTGDGDGDGDAGDGDTGDGDGDGDTGDGDGDGDAGDGDASTDPEPDAGGPDAGAPPQDEVNVEVQGPHAFDTFTSGAKAPEYAEGLVYYPTDAAGPFPAMVLSPGFTADNTDYEVWGRVLASHGIVGLLIQPSSVLDNMSARATDLKAGVGVVKNLNQSGPLAGKIDVNHIGVMGHSMGGGGTLIAANDLRDQIQAAIPLQPYEPGARFPNITAPTLIIAAQRDTVATVSSNAFTHYESIPSSTKKIFLEAAGADHYYSTDRNDAKFEINARYAVAFIKLYLEEDTRYEPYLYGAEHEKTASAMSRYLHP